MKKAVEFILKTLLVLVLIWVVVSWFDIVGDNNMPNPEHWEYNLFVLLTQLG